MSEMFTCPRCHAFVNPDWHTCRICGYDPANPTTSGGLTRPTGPTGPRFRLTEVLGGIATLVLLIGLLWFTVHAAQVFWQNRSPTTEHQVWVTVPK